MKILVVGKYYTEAFAQLIADSIEMTGHEAVRYEVGPSVELNLGVVGKKWGQIKRTAHEIARQFQSIRSFGARELQRVARHHPIDLTIICHDFLTPNEVASLKATSGKPVVMWFPDAISQFGKGYFLNAAYDALFFKDPYIVHILKRALAMPIYYLPECCEPLHYRNVSLSKEDVVKYGCDIATAGNLYSYRAAFFSELQKYDVKIWGNSPPSWLDKTHIEHMIQNEFVASDGKAKAFRGASIIVNNLNPAEIWGINVRAFEIAASGGFQLIDWRPGLSQLFADGAEIVSFRNMKELRQQIDWYLLRKDERLEIAAKGKARAHQEHTYEKRLSCLLATVAGNASGFPMPQC